MFDRAAAVIMRRRRRLSVSSLGLALYLGPSRRADGGVRDPLTTSSDRHFHPPTITTSHHIVSIFTSNSHSSILDASLYNKQAKAAH